MKINVHELAIGQSELMKESYKASDLNLEFNDLHYLKEIFFNGQVAREEGTLAIKGELTSQIEQICSRCLEPTQSGVRIPIDTVYPVGSESIVDTTTDVRDLLILNRPDCFLCAENCQGLCPKCGMNLNRNHCECAGSQTNININTVIIKSNTRKKEH
jgi:uncharacterized protein